MIRVLNRLEVISTDIYSLGGCAARNKGGLLGGERDG